MAESKDQVEKKIPFVHSLLRALGEQKLTLVQVHTNYRRLRPGRLFEKPADIRTVDVYLKTLTNHEYVNQEIDTWSEGGSAQAIVYSIAKKGRDFLNGKK